MEPDAVITTKKGIGVGISLVRCTVPRSTNAPLGF